MSNFVANNLDVYPKGQLHPSNNPLVRARLTWGILLQIATMQTHIYEREQKDKEQWQTRVQKTINEANQLNLLGLWGFQDAPLLPTPDYLALSAETGTWLESLENKLMAIFGNAIPAIITRTEAKDENFPTD